MLIRRHCVLALALLLAACDEKQTNVLEALEAHLASGLQGSDPMPLTGLTYLSERDTTELTRGTTDRQGTLQVGKTANRLGIYLDTEHRIRLASIVPATTAGTTYQLFEHIDIGGYTPPPSDSKLIVLLASLDADPTTPGTQIIARVRDAASAHATALLSLLQSDADRTELANSPGVQAMLAALDDPATSANEGKTVSDLLSTDAAAALLGLDSDIVKYPYQTVYGDFCTGSSEPTPGCTFSRQNGQRITVSADPDYNQYGYGSDDMWYVTFTNNGTASVYNDLGVFQYSANISSFAGYIGGTTIGVGTTGTYWENVAGGTYWFGDNGVLYSANSSSSNYGQAIN